MLHKLMTGALAALFVAATSFAQDTGEVVSVNSDDKTIEIKVGEKTWSVNADDVTLLNAEGEAAELDEFSAGTKVEVTRDGDLITQVQIAGENAIAFATADEGTVVSVDSDKAKMEFKVGDKTWSIDTTNVSLLDAEGNAIELADFKKDDAILVTMNGDEVTQIQKA